MRSKDIRVRGKGEGGREEGVVFGVVWSGRTRLPVPSQKVIGNEG
jgi:hypothetical protein